MVTGFLKKVCTFIVQNGTISTTTLKRGVVTLQTLPPNAPV